MYDEAVNIHIPKRQLSRIENGKIPILKALKSSVSPSIRLEYLNIRYLLDMYLEMMLKAPNTIMTGSPLEYIKLMKTMRKS
jgi:hypothetical protein